jgi:DNA polymerase I
VIIEQSFLEGRTRLYLFYRDENGQRVKRDVDYFLPYFYVSANERFSSERFPQIIKVDYGFKSISGEPLKKVIVKNPRDVSELRKQFKTAQESDVLFTQRFLIDGLKTIPHYRMRVGVFDIENAAEGKVPDAFLAEKPITAINYFDSYESKYYQFVWRSDLTPTGTRAGGKYDNEKDMLNQFMLFVNDQDPDVLAGFNIKKYDLLYIIMRANKLGVSDEMLSPLRKVEVDGTRLKVKGRIVLDALELYKHQYFAKQKYDSNSLESIAKREKLGEKTKFEGSHKELWERDLELFCKYNEQDVRLTWALFEKFKWIEALQEIHETTFCDWDTILISSFVLDALLLKKCQELRLVLPNRQQSNEEDEESFEGGAVRTVVKGLHENVCVLDVESLYPNIIRAFNISYETLDPNGEIKLGNGHSFSKTKKGLIPEIVDALLEKRIFYKKLALETKDKEQARQFGVKQWSLKILANAVFGYLGFTKSRLYKKACAESIPWVGREIIGKACDFVEKGGKRVVASDTDSVIFIGGSTLAEAQEVGEFAANEINDILFPEFCKSFGLGDKAGYFSIKFEEIYSRVIFVDKKNAKEGDEGAKKLRAGYVVWENGSALETPRFEVKGFKSKRSDSSRLAKEVQETVIHLMLDGESKEAVDAFIQGIVDKVRVGGFSWEDFGTPIGMKKSLNDYSTNVMARRACLYSNSVLGTEFGAGSKPRMAYVSRVPLGCPETLKMTVFDKKAGKSVEKEFPVDCIAFENNEMVPIGFELNVERTLVLNVFSKAEAFYDAMGWDFSFSGKKKGIEVVDERQQKLLF